MTANELITLLETSGIRFRYYQWEKPPPLPWGVVTQLGTNNLAADDIAYIKCRRYAIELCAAKKDSAAEAKIERVLDDAGIFWDSDEEYIDSERMFVIRYEVTP